MSAAAPRTAAVLSFDVDAEAPVLALGEEHRDNAMAMTHQAFGPRVGVPHTIRLLAEYGIGATFFVPGVTALRHPERLAAIAEAGDVDFHTRDELERAALDDPDTERRRIEPPGLV